MPVGSVAGYQAALDSTNTAMSYAMESTWATLPAVPFQAMRILSETLAHSKTRTRPPEIRGDRQGAPALTTEESAAGNIAYPVFFAETGRASMFDDLLSATLGGDWQVPTTINGVAADIVLTQTGGVTTLTSATANKFTGILAGQVIKLNGFTTTINNGFYRVAVVTSSTSLTLKAMGFTPVTETPTGTAAKVYYSGLRNGPYFKSLSLQQRLDPAPGSKFFRYPGAYPTKTSVTLALGQFMTATTDFVIQQELKSITDASTGAIVPAPNTRVMDPVAGFKGAYWNDQLVGSGVDSCGFDLTNDGAAAERFLGNAYAQGMLGGTFMATANINLAFADFSLYDGFRNETQGVFAVRYGDQQGNSYVFTAQNAMMIFDAGVNVSSSNAMLMSAASVECSVDSVSGVTLTIDRFPATA